MHYFQRDFMPVLVLRTRSGTGGDTRAVMPVVRRGDGRYPNHTAKVSRGKSPEGKAYRMVTLVTYRYWRRLSDDVARQLHAVPVRGVRGKSELYRLRPVFLLAGRSYILRREASEHRCSSLMVDCEVVSTPYGVVVVAPLQFETNEVRESRPLQFDVSVGPRESSPRRRYRGWGRRGSRGSRSYRRIRRLIARGEVDPDRDACQRGSPAMFPQFHDARSLRTTVHGQRRPRFRFPCSGRPVTVAAVAAPQDVRGLDYEPGRQRRWVPLRCHQRCSAHGDCRRRRGHRGRGLWRGCRCSCLRRRGGWCRRNHYRRRGLRRRVCRYFRGSGCRCLRRGWRWRGCGCGCGCRRHSNPVPDPDRHTG